MVWSIAKKVAEVYEVDQFTALSSQITALSNQFVSFTIQGAGPKDTVAMATISYPSVETDLDQAQYVNNKNFGFQGNRQTTIILVYAIMRTCRMVTIGIFCNHHLVSLISKWRRNP